MTTTKNPKLSAEAEKEARAVLAEIARRRLAEKLAAERTDAA